MPNTRSAMERLRKRSPSRMDVTDLQKEICMGKKGTDRYNMPPSVFFFCISIAFEVSLEMHLEFVGSAFHMHLERHLERHLEMPLK